jgi:hypothetical protein
VRLLSSKGLAFTAGLIVIPEIDLAHVLRDEKTLKYGLTKSQDIEAYCEVRQIGHAIVDE